MPIQPMSINKYNQIIDQEDVTPIDGALAKKAKRSIKYTILITLACLISIIAIIYAGYAESYKRKSHIRVYQTAKSYHDQLFELNSWAFVRRGFFMDYLDFGNTICTDLLNMDKEKYLCKDLSKSSKVLINTAETYQSVVGFGGAFTEASAYNFYKLPKHAQVSSDP